MSRIGPGAMSLLKLITNRVTYGPHVIILVPITLGGMVLAL
jgi:hypothetical protein